MVRRIYPLCVLALLSAGCANQLHGRWVADSPADPKSPCTFQHVEFKEDKTFTASATVEGKATPMQGTWEFAWGKLKIKSDRGKEREYDAGVEGMGNRLKVVEEAEGKKVTQWFKKENA